MKKTVIIFDWYVVFTLDKKIKLGYPRCNALRTLHILHRCGYDISLRYPVLIKRAFLEKHISFFRLPPINILYRPLDSSIYITFLNFCIYTKKTWFQLSKKIYQLLKISFQKRCRFL